MSALAPRRRPGVGSLDFRKAAAREIWKQEDDRRRLATAQVSLLLTYRRLLDLAAELGDPPELIHAAAACKSALDHLAELRAVLYGER